MEGLGKIIPMQASLSLLFSDMVEGCVLHQSRLCHNSRWTNYIIYHLGTNQQGEIWVQPSMNLLDDFWVVEEAEWSVRALSSKTYLIHLPNLFTPLG